MTVGESDPSAPPVQEAGADGAGPSLINGTTSEVPPLTPAAWLRSRSGQPAA